LMHYPPYSAMARLVVRGKTVERTQQFAEHIAERLKAELIKRQSVSGPENRLLGPAPAPIPRLRGMYRFHMQAQCGDGTVLRETIRAATGELEMPDDVQWIVDVDPIDML
jgi:primosomal protein N' (replication factor Y) (superfamily II helicase)